MTETSELQDDRVTAQPSPKRPDRVSAPPDAQTIPGSAEVDYLAAAGDVAADERTPHQHGRRDAASPASGG